MRILIDDRVEDILQQLWTEVEEARQPLQLRRPKGVGEGVGTVGEALEEVGGALKHALRHDQSTFDLGIGQHRGQQPLQLGHRRGVTAGWEGVVRERVAKRVRRGNGVTVGHK